MEQPSANLQMNAKRFSLHSFLLSNIRSLKVLLGYALAFVTHRARWLAYAQTNFLYTPMLEVSRTPSASLSSFRLAPLRSKFMAKVWRRFMGETRHIPTWSQRFQIVFCSVFEVVTGRAARATINSGVWSSRLPR